MSRSKDVIAYDLMDAGIVPLARLFNSFQAIRTLGSCEGHLNPGPTQHPHGHWFVTFSINRSPAGWLAVEFLSWAVTDFKTPGRVSFEYSPSSLPPIFEPTAAQRGFWSLSGAGSDPIELACWLEGQKAERYKE